MHEKGIAKLGYKKAALWVKIKTFWSTQLSPYFFMSEKLVRTYPSLSRFQESVHNPQGNGNKESYVHGVNL